LVYIVIKPGNMCARLGVDGRKEKERAGRKDRGDGKEKIERRYR
jgi:hypothetical protein